VENMGGTLDEVIVEWREWILQSTAETGDQ
jgi:hypothetical protein